MKYQTKHSDNTVEIKRDRLGYPLIEWCCDAMKAAYDEGFIDFGARGWGNQLNGFCIYDVRCYPEGTTVCKKKIEYCPFCAEKIEEQEEKDRDVTRIF